MRSNATVPRQTRWLVYLQVGKFELVREQFLDSSKDVCLGIIDRLVADGAEGIVLGCTELPILIKAEDVPVPSFDTMTIHAVAAAERAME